MSVCVCVCAFDINLDILVNECPTSEISIQRGLKQSHPLAHFMFLLMAIV